MDFYRDYLHEITWNYSQKDSYFPSPLPLGLSDLSGEDRRPGAVLQVVEDKDLLQDTSLYVYLMPNCFMLLCGHQCIWRLSWFTFLLSYRTLGYLTYVYVGRYRLLVALERMALESNYSCGYICRCIGAWSTESSWSWPRDCASTTAHF